MSRDEASRNKAIGKKFVNGLIGGDYEKCCAMFDEAMAASLTPTALKAGWDATIMRVGEIEKIEDIKVVSMIVDVIIKFKMGCMDVRLTINENEKVSGLNLSAYNPSTIPAGLAEEKVTVGEGTPWKLNGVITTAGGQRSDIAVVLVHGSGASDMDETVLANSPLRDVAWSLCKKGIDSIRYDKRTFVYGAKMVSMKDLTVKEETIDDAVIAGKILKDRGYKTVFLVGHSMGGMLAPRIISVSGDIFKGFVSLAGSPRSLINIMIDQSHEMFAAIPDATVREANETALKVETDKVPFLSVWTDSEAMEKMLFGVNAYYFKEMCEYDAAEIAKSLDCPMLFLQGSNDFQVDVEKDFNLWKKALDGHAGAEFILYEGLNHLFMAPDCQTTRTIADYNTPSHVDEKVIDDIVGFIEKNV